MGGRSIIKYQTDDKGTHLTFQQAMDGTYKGSVDNSTKEVTDKLLTGVSSSCIPAVKGSSNASYKGGMYFDNYIPKDPDQSLQITAALLMMGNGTNTTSIWKKTLGNKTETPYTYEFTVDDKAPEIAEANLSSDELFTEDSVYVEAKVTDNTGSDTNTSTEDTTKPDDKGDTKPAENPKPSTKPAENPKPSQKPTTNLKPSTKPAGNALLKTGTQVSDKKTGAVYKVNGIRTVEYKKSLKKTTVIAIPSVVNIKGVKYQVTSIAPKAFMNNKKLKKVVIPATIRSIGKKAFAGCKNLKKITVKTPYFTKKSVGAKAFKEIHAKAAIKVPKKQKKPIRLFLKHFSYCDTSLKQV